MAVKLGHDEKTVRTHIWDMLELIAQLDVVCTQYGLGWTRGLPMTNNQCKLHRENVTMLREIFNDINEYIHPAHYDSCTDSDSDDEPESAPEPKSDSDDSDIVVDLMGESEDEE